MIACEYRVVECCRWVEFYDLICFHMSRGCQPQGGVCVSFNGGGAVKSYVQAIIRPADAVPAEQHHEGGTS